MDQLVGTRNCPHLGFDLSGGRPCCRADDLTRQECGRFAPNPTARKSGAGSSVTGVEAYFCTVLGTDTIPAEALRLGEDDKRRARQQARDAGPKFRAPGQAEGLPDRAQHDVENPVIPTHTIRAEGKQVGPNAPCPCGSGKKFKKCCGRFG